MLDFSWTLPKAPWAWIPYPIKQLLRIRDTAQAPQQIIISRNPQPSNLLKLLIEPLWIQDPREEILQRILQALEPWSAQVLRIVAKQVLTLLKSLRKMSWLLTNKWFLIHTRQKMLSTSKPRERLVQAFKMISYERIYHELQNKGMWII